MNNLEGFYYWLEELPLTLLIGGTWLFPLLESLHVIGAVLVFGAIVMADLRLLGVIGSSYSTRSFVQELVPWSVGGFVLALITGLGMFVTRASGYAHNSAFLWKMALLLLAAINIIYFHRWVFPRLLNIGNDSGMLASAKLSGGCSLLLWLGVMLAGRWTGHLI